MGVLAYVLTGSQKSIFWLLAAKSHETAPAFSQLNTRKDVTSCCV
jgi:hypothetical protein